MPGGIPVPEQVARAEATLAAAEAWAADYAQRAATAAAAGRPLRGRPVVNDRVGAATARLARAKARAELPPVEARRSLTRRANVTDPDTRTMRTARGWVQGYNAQLAVTENQVVLAAAVTQDATDVAHLHPLIAGSEANLAAVKARGEIVAVVADAGYCSTANLTRPSSPPLFIATTKSWKQRIRTRRLGVAVGDPPPGLAPIDAMEHRLRTAAGAAIYKKRAITVEPVIGQIKTRGFARFHRRGIAAVTSEWLLACTTHNLLKLHRHRLAAA